MRGVSITLGVRHQKVRPRTGDTEQMVEDIFRAERSYGEFNILFTHSDVSEMLKRLIRKSLYTTLGIED